MMKKKIIKKILIIAKQNDSQLHHMKLVTHNVFQVLIEPNGKLLFLGDKGPGKNKKKFAQYNKGNKSGNSYGINECFSFNILFIY